MTTPLFDDTIGLQKRAFNIRKKEKRHSILRVSRTTRKKKAENNNYLFHRVNQMIKHGIVFVACGNFRTLTTIFRTRIFALVFNVNHNNCVACWMRQSIGIKNIISTIDSHGNWQMRYKYNIIVTRYYITFYIIYIYRIYYRLN